MSAIYPQIKNGHFGVEMIFVDEPPKALQPGQSLDAKVTLGEPTPALYLPNAAFANDSGGAWVYVADALDGAQRRPVRTGRRNNGQIEVLSGLAAGERVIVSSYAAFGQAERIRLVK